MTTDTQLDDGGETRLKGKEFDDACQLCADDVNAKVFVNQKPEGSGRWDFCFSFVPGEYDEAQLLELLVLDYGPGEYPVQIRSKTDDDQSRIRWQKNMRVVARRRPLTQQQPAPVAAAPSNDALAMAIENQTRLLGAVLEKISHPAPPPEQKNIVDLAKDLIPLKELFGGDKKSPFDSYKELLEMQALMVEAAGGDTDPLTKALNMFGPRIVEELDKEKQQPARPATPAQPVAQQPAPQPKFAHIDVESAYSIFAENYLGRLLSIPGEPSPEELGKYMAKLVGNSQETLHVVGLVIEQDDMVERLAQSDARVLDRAEWLDSIADWLAHALWPDTNPAPTPENATINATIDEIPVSRDIKAASTEGGADDDQTKKPEAGPLGDDGPGSRPSPGELDNDP